MKKLYRVLVVDDEKIILDGLTSTYPWMQTGFTVCGTAQNGEQALKQCEVLNPDIVMTDIRMKSMDGLELIRRVKKQYPQMEFVVISAYRDFEYAQTACSLDVFSYLLKPFSDEDFLQVMGALKEYMDQKNQTKQAAALFEKYQEELLSLQLRKYLTSNDTGLEERFMEFYPQWTPNIKYACICVDIDQTLTYLLHEDREVYRYIQLQLFVDLVKSKLPCVSVELADQRRILVVYGENLSDQMLKDTFEEMIAKLEAEGYVNCYYAAYGQCLMGYEGMKNSFHQAVTGLELAYEGENFLGYSSQTKHMSGKGVYPKEQEEKILTLLRTGAMEQLEQEISRFQKILEDAQADFSFICLCYQQLGLNIQFWLHPLCALEEKSVQSYTDFLLSLDTVRSEQLVKAMTVMTQNFVEQAGAPQNSNTESAGQYFHQAVSYIQEHLDNGQMSIGDAAEALHLNPVYFGRVFKKESGQSFREYLLHQRIQKACELFDRTHLSVTEIALSVGMDNLSYFSTQFKKCTGVLPSEYRR